MVRFSFKKILILYFWLILLLFFIIIQIKSQNLVPNPSFESFINFDAENSIGWHKAQRSDTPDYFNLSNNNPHNNIFNDYTGGTKPKSGNGFVGIFCLRIEPKRNIKNIREFIEAPLLNTLEKDSLYKVEVSLCLDNESNIAIKNFAIFFSGSPNVNNKDLKSLTIKPQIEFNSSFLDSTQSWIVLQSFYKANGIEKYICLGNFMTDKLTKVKSVVPIKEKGKHKKWALTKKELASYYYIDDLLVEKVTIINNFPPLIKNDETAPNKQFFDINEIVIDSSIVLKNIIFEFNKSDLLPESYDEINKLKHLMISNPDIRVKLEGHTDNIGDYDFNLILSQKRVESVTNYLIGQGINSNRIEYAGYSYSFPLASNETDEGRSINRRVAFKIIQK